MRPFFIVVLCLGVAVIFSFLKNKDTLFLKRRYNMPGRTEQDLEAKRKRMVTAQIQSRGIKDQRVLNALLKVPRHIYVPRDIRGLAYEDNALPINKNQTISQPFIVGLMTELAKLGPESKVLEIGTGSGYQAAILAEIVKDVYTIEIIETLADEARGRLDSQGYTNIHVKCGNGYLGWPEEAPFDSIIVTAAPKEIPESLIGQLKTGGRMVIPLGDVFQELFVITKNEDGSTKKEHIIPVRFVPMVESAE